MAKAVRFRRESQSEFAKAFRPLGERHSTWQVWADFVVLTAISISAPFGIPEDKRHQQREKEYQSIMSRYSPEEQKVFPTLFVLTINALEAEPEQDFLGEMFMALELGNHWKGQFFTPYDVCKMMAQISMTDIGRHIEQKGWVGIMDPACGAGALLIAARNCINFARPPIGYLPGHLHALYVCQDVDRVAALMCYIQLSLLGCAGYVIVGNSLTNPGVCLYGNPLLPVEKEGQEIWTMPLFHDQVWVFRQAIAKLSALERPTVTAAVSEPVREIPVTELKTPAKPGKMPETLRKAPLTARKAPAPEPEPEPFSETETGQLTFF